MFYHPNMISGMRRDSQIAADEQIKQSFLPPEADIASSSAVHKTLIPVDGSESANRAIEYAGRLARGGWTSEIHLLNVQPLVMQEEFALTKGAVQAEQRAREAAARKILNRARELLRDSGVDCRNTIGFGRTAKMIVRYAREHGIDAIVMGTRAKRGFSRLLGRSVAATVARLAEVPVTVLRSVGANGAHLKQTGLPACQPAPAQ